jgi:hypothetical protein
MMTIPEVPKKQPHSWRLHWSSPAGLILLAVLLAVGGYLWFSLRVQPPGFPLDDAWIHQTYARNLAQLGEWAFVPGEVSGGSTAPLWSALLATGYALRIDPFVWAFILGSVCLFGVAWVGEYWLRRLGSSAWPSTAWVSRLPWGGWFLAGEWHLVWAAVSGMETLLFGAMVLLAMVWVQKAQGRRWFWLGLLVGLSIWVRPDGITLLGPAGVTLLLVEPDLRSRIKAVGWLAVGFALLFLPYLGFNVLIQGSIWPNTFYAKQAEYAVMRETPFLTRLLRELSLPLIGGGMFLLPGFLALVWFSWKERQWAALAATVWFIGYGGLYAIRLPVTYQYGRYFMPAMPVYFILGLAGTLRLAALLSRRRLAWLAARVILISLMGIWAAFYGVGAGQYVQNVRFIQTQMVATARWVADHTEADALIAAHDIGAMGYFGQRRILDLAGLISPEVIPFIRDEDHLREYLTARRVDYLVTLTDWYETLSDGKPELFAGQVTAQDPPDQPRMQIFRWLP